VQALVSAVHAHTLPEARLNSAVAAVLAARHRACS
jgi:hypothetical protein